jgi:putative peptidoglycan lipid II flippase
MFKRQSILRATTTLGVSRILYQLLLFAQFAYFLYAYGSSSITDALIIAQGLPFLLSNLFNRGFTHTFIPLFVDVFENRSNEEASKFTSALISFTFLALVGLMLVIFVFAPFFIRILAPGFSYESRKLSANLLRYLSMLIVLNGMSGVPRCLYFAFRSFTVPAISSLFLSSSVIAAIFFFKDKLGIHAVVLGVIAGSFAQLVTLTLFLNAGEERFKFRFLFWHKGIKEFAALIFPRMLSMGIARLNIIIDRMFASVLGASFVSALSYADRICTAPMEFINATFGAVIIPVLSKDAALGDLEIFKEKICQYIRIVSFVIVPLMILFIILGKPIIQILFQRGAFGARGVPLTAAALTFYSLGLLPLAIGTILRGSFFALKDTITPFKVGCISFFLNVAFDYVLAKYLSIRGLALATSLVQAFSAIILLILIQRKIGLIRLAEIKLLIGKILLAGASMGIVVWFFSSQTLLIKFQNVLIAKSFHLTIAIISGGLIYFLMCHTLQVEETAMVISQFRKMGSRFQRRKDTRVI